MLDGVVVVVVTVLVMAVCVVIVADVMTLYVLAEGSRSIIV